MVHAIVYIIGVVFGAIASTIIFAFRHKRLGVMEVNESDPENVKWRFVITDDTIDFSKQKYISLKVDYNANLSQK